jgi:DNA-binding response OmpR family regulator
MPTDSPVASQAAGRRVGGMGRMLVIDDEDAIRFAAKEYFEAQGFEVDCAQELEEAEALLSNLKYAIVIADLRLTGIYGTEGLSLVGFVRERCPGTRIILLTAYGSPEIEQEARRLGVDCFLRKPKPLPDVAQIALGLLGRNS